MKSLTFDQSLTTSGWAFGTENSSAREGSNEPYRYGKIVVPKRDNLGERLAHFWREANALALELQPDIIAYEEPFFPVQQGSYGKRSGGGFVPATGFLDAEIHEGDGAPKGRGAAFNPETIKALQMVKGAVITMAALRDIPCFGYAPSQWRVTLLGYGRAPKGADDNYMKKAVLERLRILGFDVKSHDVGDALGILYHSLHGKEAAARKQGDLLDMARGGL